MTIDHWHRHTRTLTRIYAGLMRNLYSENMNKAQQKEYKYIANEFKKAHFTLKLIERHLL